MDNFISFQIHGGERHDGLLEAVSSFLSLLEGSSETNSSDLLSNLLPGIASLDNLHPLFVHFPIALLSAFFIVNLVAQIFKKEQLHTVASWLLYIGAFSAIFTVLAGFNAAESVEHGENVHDIMEHHEEVGVSILSLSLGLAAWRIKSGVLKNWLNSVFLLLSALLFGLVVQGADLGGLMVYKYGVAVHPAVAEPAALTTQTSKTGVLSTGTQSAELPAPTTEAETEHHHHDHGHHHDHH